MAEQTESSIVIFAAPSVIMDVIADLPAYPQWSDGITSVQVLSLLRRTADRPMPASN